MEKNRVALTPPMGWNSWDCYGAAVNEEQLLGNAAYMCEHLKEFGWEYVVCDIQWYEPQASSTCYNAFAPLCMDAFARLLPAENRFPSAAGGKGFAPIAEKIHAMGLQFGIHILRGIPRQAVHGDAKILGSTKTAREIASPYSLCPWNTDMYGVDASREGAQEYYDSLFALYASWGVDYVKVDDIANTEFKPAEPYSARGEIECIRRAIDRCQRPMVLSLSPGPAPVTEAAHLSRNANLWRMTGDFWDDWQALRRMFARCEQWYAWVREGCWPDCDMLPLGRICMNDPQPDCRARMTRFTKEEQYTLMNLWCIFRSPLMMGGELRENDAFTLSLLTNRELLEINRYGSGAHPVLSDGQAAVWCCRDAQGRDIVALFNLADTARTLTASWETIGTAAPRTLYELWTKKESAADAEGISAFLAPHASVVYRIQA